MGADGASARVRRRGPCWIFSGSSPDDHGWRQPRSRATGPGSRGELQPLAAASAARRPAWLPPRPSPGYRAAAGRKQPRWGTIARWLAERFDLPAGEVREALAAELAAERERTAPPSGLE